MRNLRALGICAAIAIGASLGTFAPAALAAPSNDEFAQRQFIGNQLPVHLSESNAEATRDGYLEVGPFAKGHSIWWEWESPSTQWTTVGTCGSEFQTVVGVFAGTELQRLTPMASGNADEGPGCYDAGSRYTFWAEAGQRYDIAADGVGFYLPPQEPPSGEGTISLAIEATPPPPNDAFAAAIPIEGPYAEINANPITEPGGPKRLIRQVFGYNWGATAEPGEPLHAGVPGGASVWYRWTPPVSGEALIDSQGGPGLLALYGGTTLTGLTPLGSIARPYEPFQAHVDAGTEYRIAVDGASVEGKATMGALKFDVALIPDQPLSPPSESASSAPGRPSAKADPTAAERTGEPAVPTRPVLVRPAIDAATGTATFRFHGSRAGLAYSCKVDAKGPRACSSPYEVRGLAPGRHRLEVRARVPGGALSRATVVHFWVPAAHRRHHQAG
ncbi:MAG: hypothetical protein JST59_17945 [Actinobacteria bacterium]|nr:hypothetical protein [Actinomycetota bacterium]